MICIRNKQGVIITKDDEIRDRWREYFNKLLNVENEREEHLPTETIEDLIENVTLQEVVAAIKNMKKGKSTITSGFSIDFIKVLKEEGEKMVHKMVELIWKEGKMPSEWELSELVPIYKQKGDPLECLNYRGLKLLQHLFKVTERILDQCLKKLIKVDDKQFGFSPGKGTTDAVFVVKQMQEKLLEGLKDLYFTFVDLEKAYDRVPRELVYWCMRKRGIPEKLIELVKATYKGAKTIVRTAVVNTLPFEIKVGLHQGSILSPFLLVLVLDTISCELRQGIPWELLFADDLVVMGETEEEMQEKWVKWQEGMERMA